ncbi:MAG: TetR/AcrR family transcriptional regulator [Hyphomicrobiales bacterium]|nr:TetR/AcrR family transcriptional regulator [Hyphomicrobiales bacterium]
MLNTPQETKQNIIRAARNVLLEHGYSGLSTRRVADAAGTQMSQIRYHFGSKGGLILALFQDMNNELLERQRTMFGAGDLTLSEQWDMACDFLEEDLASGYVRVLQELIAAGWSNPQIKAEITAGLSSWLKVLTGVARKAEARFGKAEPFAAEEIAALVAAAFIGAEAHILLGITEDQMPLKSALRRFGDVFRQAERATTGGSN